MEQAMKQPICRKFNNITLSPSFRARLGTTGKNMPKMGLFCIKLLKTLRTNIVSALDFVKIEMFM